MTTYRDNGSSNGSSTGAQEPGIGQRVDQIGADAQQLWDNARGAVTDLRDTVDLRGRVERNPYLMVAAALGVGYVLGGGLFTRTTGRLLRLGMRLAALPMVKDELIGMAEAVVRGIEVGAGRVSERQSDASPGMQEPPSGRQV